MWGSLLGPAGPARTSTPGESLATGMLPPNPSAPIPEVQTGVLCLVAQSKLYWKDLHHPSIPAFHR